MSPESQKIKILAMKLTSLRAEIKASKEVANSASLQVDKLFLEENTKEVLGTQKLEEVEEKKTQPIKAEKPERHPSQEINANPDTKNAFRKIALKLHPDKLVDLPPGPEKDKKMTLYQRATKALEEGDLITLADITIDIGLVPPEIPEEYIKKATDEINTIKKGIKHIESTYVWQWFFCYDKEEKKQLLEKMFELIYERDKKQNPGP
jgi:hypothetical protein